MILQTQIRGKNFCHQKKHDDWGALNINMSRQEAKQIKKPLSFSPTFSKRENRNTSKASTWSSIFNYSSSKREETQDRKDLST